MIVDGFLVERPSATRPVMSDCQSLLAFAPQSCLMLLKSGPCANRSKWRETHFEEKESVNQWPVDKFDSQLKHLHSPDFIIFWSPHLSQSLVFSLPVFIYIYLSYTSRFLSICLCQKILIYLSVPKGSYLSVCAKRLKYILSIFARRFISCFLSQLVSIYLSLRVHFNLLHFSMHIDSCWDNINTRPGSHVGRVFDWRQLEFDMWRL